MIVIVALLWFCLFAAPAIGTPFEGISMGGYCVCDILQELHRLLSLELPGFLAILNSYSILAFQFDIHPVLLTLQIDMKHKSQVSWAALIGIASE